jgi:hypothetical protein
MTDFPHTTNLRGARPGVSITHKECIAMKNVTTATSRRDQERLRELVAVMGENVVLVLLEAARQNSERPLMNLPDKWRDKAIASFRQFIKK